jgi:hypothetical protein
LFLVCGQVVFEVIVRQRGNVGRGSHVHHDNARSCLCHFRAIDCRIERS